MSTRRDAVLFLLAALVPSAATGLLGWRALRNEEAALRREAAADVERQAETIARTCRQQLEEAEGALATAASGSSVGDEKVRLEAYEKAVRVAPAFSEAIVVSAEGKLLLPRQERAIDVASERACADAVKRLTTPERAEATTAIVSGCEEARDSRGRWIWPVIAVERLAKTEDDALATRLATWTEGHADKLRREERAVLAEEVAAAGSIPAPQRERVKTALAAPQPAYSSDTPVLTRALVTATFVDATRGPSAVPGATVSFRGDGIAGAVSVLDDGGLVGFVATEGALTRALAGPGRSVTPAEGFVATATSRADAAPVSGAPESIAWIADGLGVRVRFADSKRLDRLTTRSERLLVGLIAAGILLALGLAALLYLRMRATRRTSELRTSFVAGISHELRTPLASVRMLSELLAEGRVEEGERAEVSEALAREARRMSDTVERFMAYARSERGRLTVVKKPIDALEIANERAAAFRERHPDAVIEVTSEGPHTLEGDRPLLEIVIDNLLENALKYAPAGQPYEVHVKGENGALEISVTDSGPGVPRARRGKIFDAFERGDDRLSKATSGTGLGLFLVATIAKSHGGRAGLADGRDKGSRFFVMLPTTSGKQGERG